MRGCRKPASMIGDSFAGWMDTLRTHAAAERTRGRYDECRRRRRGFKPSAFTISTWYFSMVSMRAQVLVTHHRWQDSSEQAQLGTGP